MKVFLVVVIGLTSAFAQAVVLNNDGNAAPSSRIQVDPAAPPPPPGVQADSAPSARVQVESGAPILPSLVPDNSGTAASQVIAIAIDSGIPPVDIDVDQPQIQTLDLGMTHTMEEPIDGNGTMYTMEEPNGDDGMMHTMEEPNGGDGMMHIMVEPVDGNGTMYTMEEPNGDDGMMHTMVEPDGSDGMMHMMDGADSMADNGTFHTMVTDEDNQTMHILNMDNGTFHTMLTDDDNLTMHILSMDNGTFHTMEMGSNASDGRAALRACFRKLLMKADFSVSQDMFLQKAKMLCTEVSADQVTSFVMNYQKGLNILNQLFHNMSSGDMTTFSNLRQTGNKTDIRDFFIQHTMNLPDADRKSVEKLMKAMLKGKMLENPLITLEIGVDNDAEFQKFMKNLRARKADEVNSFVNAQLAVVGKYTDNQKTAIQRAVANKLAKTVAGKK